MLSFGDILCFSESGTLLRCELFDQLNFRVDGFGTEPSIGARQVGWSGRATFASAYIVRTHVMNAKCKGIRCLGDGVVVVHFTIFRNADLRRPTKKVVCAAVRTVVLVAAK